MAIEIKTIICPQCGSTDVNMSSESQGVCTSCGAQFVVQQEIETQNVYNEYIIQEETKKDSNQDKCIKTEIPAEFSKDEFLRKAWIQLAKEDAPIEIFGEDFSDVSVNEHQVLIESLHVDVSYQAGIGYNREEPYIAYEDYWEQEPYITTESYYDSNTKTTRTRQVTKYRSVQKQRQVTKYKTVTDWSTLNGSHITKSLVTVENAEGEYLDKDLFLDSFNETNTDSFLIIPEELSDQMQITDSARDKANSEHVDNIDESVRNSLPGDDYRDLDWKVSEIIDSITVLYKTPEYQTTIYFNDELYVRYAFPFGNMKIEGNEIPNRDSLEKAKKQMTDDLSSQKYARRKEVEKKVSKSTNGFSLLTLLILTASVLVSLLVLSIPLVLIVFAVAVASFALNTITVNAVYKKEEKLADEEIDILTKKIEKEIADYTKNHKTKLYKALDDKLKSLGYEPTSADEL